MYAPSQYQQPYSTSGTDNKPGSSVVPLTTINVKNPLVAELKKVLD